MKKQLYPAIVIEPSEPIENYTLNYSETCNYVKTDAFIKDMFWSDRANMFRSIDLKIPQSCTNPWEEEYKSVMHQIKHLISLDRISEEKLGYDPNTFKITMHISNMGDLNTAESRYFNETIYASSCLEMLLRFFAEESHNIQLEIADKLMDTYPMNDSNRFDVITNIRNITTRLGYRYINLYTEVYTDHTLSNETMLNMEQTGQISIANLETHKFQEPDINKWHIENKDYQKWLWIQKRS